MKKERLEEQVREAVRFAIGYLENQYLNDDELEAITIKEAVDYTYSYFVEDQDYMNDFKSNVRFYGKKNTLKMIEEEIRNNSCIKLID